MVKSFKTLAPGKLPVCNCKYLQISRKIGKVNYGKSKLAQFPEKKFQTNKYLLFEFCSGHIFVCHF